MKKKVLIIIVLVLAIAAGGAALLRTLLYKHPMELYIEAEGNYLNSYINELKSLYKNFHEYNLPYLSGKYNTEYEIWAEVNPEGLPGEFQNMVSLLKNLRIKVNANTDMDLEGGSVLASLLIGNTPLADIHAYYDRRNLYFSIPVIMPDTWFKVDREHVGEVYQLVSERYGIEFIRPKSAPAKAGFHNAFYFSESDMDSLARDYGSFLKSFLKEDNLSYGSTASYIVNDEKVNVREVVIRLSPDEIGGLVGQLADKLANDEAFLKVTFGNLSSLVNYLDNTGILQALKFVDINDYKKTLNGANDPETLKKMLLWFKDVSFKGDATMSVLIGPNGNILNRTIEMPVRIPGGSEYTIKLVSGKSSIKEEGNRFFEVEVASGKTVRFGVNESTNNATGQDGREKVIKFWYDDGFVEENGIIEIIDNIDELTLVKNKRISYELSGIDKRTGKAESIKGSIEIQRIENDKYKTRDENLRITADIDLFSRNLDISGLGLNIKSKDNFGIEKIEPLDIAGKEIIVLDDLTEEGISQLEGRVLMSFGMFYLKNKELLDSITVFSGQ
jgi:hypothetical protein